MTLFDPAVLAHGHGSADAMAHLGHILAQDADGEEGGAHAQALVAAPAWVGMAGGFNKRHDLIARAFESLTRTHVLKVPCRHFTGV